MYCVHDRTRYPFRASGLVNSFLGLNVSWQNSSKLCPFLVAVVAMSVPPASDYLGLLEPGEIIAGKAQQPAVDILVVVAGGTAQPLQAARRLMLLVRSRAVQDLAVMWRVGFGDVAAILEMGILGHFVDIEHTARGDLLLAKFGLGLAA